MKKVKVALLVITISCVCTLWMLSNSQTSSHALFQLKEVLVDDAALPLSVQGGRGTIKNLSSQVIDGVKTFVFFLGSGSSGHSIVGSLMDAHPHVIISHEYHIFRNWLKFYRAGNPIWTEALFNSLYLESVSDASGIRNFSAKGYSLKVENLWQGRFDHYIDVIGDKSGGSTTQLYIKNKMLFEKRFNILKHELQMPVRVIHVVRNPFDHIATRSLYNSFGNILEMSNIREKLKSGKSKDSFQLKNHNIVKKEALEMLAHYEAAVAMTKLFGGRNVLEVHISDLISNPKAILHRIFEFVGVDASEDFLEVCARKVFKTGSRTRELVVWPAPVKEMVKKRMKNCGFLARYNFTSN